MPRLHFARWWILGGLVIALCPPVEAAVRDSLHAPGKDPAPLRLSFYPEGDALDPRLDHESPIRSGDDSRFTSDLRYNRVQGFAVRIGALRRLDRGRFRPAFRGIVGYGFSSRRGVYEVAFEQPVLPRTRVTVGAEAFRRVDPFFYGEQRISLDENTLSGIFVRRDYQDWYEAEGLRGFVGFHPGPDLNARFGIVTQKERALSAEAGFSLFRRKSDFRDNPAIPGGTYRGYEAEIALDTRPREAPHDEVKRRGAWNALEFAYTVRWERGDPGLDSDTDSWRVDADLRTYFRLSSDQSVSTRLWLGTGDGAGGVLPPHRRFVIGGLGTLRGQNFGDRSGDHVALANLEYAFGVGGDRRLLVFGDAGTAWDAGSLGDQKILVDTGAGLRLGDPGVTLLVARSVNRTDPDVKLYLRFARSF